MKLFLKKPSAWRTSNERRVDRSRRPRQPLIRLGRASQYLQGADGSYSDGNCLRSYYK